MSTTISTLPEWWHVWRPGDPRLDELIAELLGTEVRPYSTDWEAAKTLIPRHEFGESGMRCALICDANGVWYAVFRPGSLPVTVGHEDMITMGHTPAHAICRAWLAWKESEGK